MLALFDGKRPGKPKCLNLCIKNTVWYPVFCSFTRESAPAFPRRIRKTPLAVQMAIKVGLRLSQREKGEKIHEALHHADRFMTLLDMGYIFGGSAAFKVVLLLAEGAAAIPLTGLEDCQASVKL